MSLALRRAGSSGPPDTANGQYVSGNFFQTLGVSAWRGRLLIDGDDQEGASPVAVMSFHAWLEKYGSDPSVVGSTYQINGRSFTIIGVAPAGFVGAKMVSWGMPDIWMPLMTEPMSLGTTARIKNTRVDWLDLIGRVRPGTNPKALQAQLQSELHGWLASHLADMNPQEKAVWQKQALRVSPGGGGFSGLVPLFCELQDRLSTIPGVRGVSSATYAPMTDDQWGHDIRVQGKPEPGPKDDVSADGPA